MNRLYKGNLILVFLFFSSCKQAKHIEGPPVSANDPLIAKKAESVLAARCGHCHGEKSPGLGDINYILNPEKLMSLGQIIAGSPAVSNIYTEIENNDMPPANPLSESEKSMIYYWIVSLGAGQEKISFDKVFSEIISPKCVSCHSGATPEGGIKLETFANVTATVWSGFPEGSLLYDSISQNRMPKAPDDPLTDDEKLLIYNWIKGGALEQ